MLECHSENRSEITTIVNTVMRMNTGMMGLNTDMTRMNSGCDEDGEN